MIGNNVMNDQPSSGIAPAYLSYVPILGRRILKVALFFWAFCLTLGAIEGTVGSGTIVASIFFLSVPVLVGFLTWANYELLYVLPRRLTSVLVLGGTLMLSSTAVVMVGLLAAAGMKTMLLGS